MILIRTSLCKKTRIFLESFNISKNNIDNFLTFIANDVKNTKKNWSYKIRIEIDINDEYSNYYFGSKDAPVLYIGGKNIKKSASSLKFFIGSIIHEFIHFIQDWVLKHKSSEINYYNKDGDIEPEAYRQNPLEQQCNHLEKIYTPIFLTLYVKNH